MRLGTFGARTRDDLLRRDDVRLLRRALVTAAMSSVVLLLARPAFAGIIEDAVRAGLEGMLSYVVARVNSMVTASVPTSFSNLFDGDASASHEVFLKASQLYAGGVARSVAATILSLVMLVQLVKIAGRADASSTFPAAREVVGLLVVCAVYTWLVGHAWDLMRALFSDLSALWSGWSAEVPQTVSDISLDGLEGLSAMLPLFVSSAVCMLLTDLAVIVSRLVCWTRGIQLYFYATMSPIPLALLGIDETRHMGVGFLKNYGALVLGYAALAFVLDLFPTLLAMAVRSSWQAGGPSEMVLSVAVGCILQVVLVTKCGSWARDLLGG